MHLGLERFRPLRNRFRLPLKSDRFNGVATSYISDTGFELMTNILIVVVGLCLLSGPMWLLKYVDSDQVRLGIITGFVFIFAVLMFLTVGHRPYKVLIATVIYAVALVVSIRYDRTHDA